VFVRSTVVVGAVMASVALVAPQASAASGYRAHWMLDETSGSTATDSSGNGNNGTSYNVVGSGSGYTFNGTNARVVVPNAPSLNPGAADFSFGVTMTMTTPPTPSKETYDVLRKGLSTTKGGDYKLEIVNSSGKAQAHCVIRSYRSNGTKVLASVVSGGTTLADGQQHTVTCLKSSTGITVKVDARAPKTRTYAGGLGSTSNTSKLGLGAKAEATASTGFDWFKGVLWDAWVS
jgi:hypothetical protein